MEPDALPPLPPFNYHGYLPEGVHDTTLNQLHIRLAINPRREVLWRKLGEFLEWAVSTNTFSHAYIDGGFITAKANPEDIDVILQTRAKYGIEAFAAMEPFFARGLDLIYTKYSVHLHFWCEGFPGGMSDFRRFFQYLRPQDAAPLGLMEGARKGIVRIKL
jgi:hypothetical protein